VRYLPPVVGIVDGLAARLDSAGIPVTKERGRNSSRRVRSSGGTFLDGILSADRLQTSIYPDTNPRLIQFGLKFLF
jgi:hypothetical protein